ncbi:MAG TPA: aspartate/glutamate racemase family protein, partial [Nitrospiraceae bacterium]
WLHIADAVAAEAAHQGFRRLGLLGTPVVMEGSIYPKRLRPRGLEYGIPDPADRLRITRIIEHELIAGRYTKDSRSFLQGVISQMRTQGYDAVILGCTELPMLLVQEESALPLLDSAQLLANAALTRASFLRGARVISYETTPSDPVYLLHQE